jgi:hypothetical protein
MNSPRLLSLLLALVDVLLISPPASRPGDIIPLLVISLVLIWFCEIFGSFKGPMARGGYVDTETPGGCFAALGWLGLFGVFIYLVLFRGHTAAPSP